MIVITVALINATHVLNKSNFFANKFNPKNEIKNEANKIRKFGILTFGSLFIMVDPVKTSPTLKI